MILLLVKCENASICEKLTRCERLNIAFIGGGRIPLSPPRGYKNNRAPIRNSQLEMNQMEKEKCSKINQDLDETTNALVN